MPKKVTIRQVAAKAGVSITAVSQILNGKGERFPNKTQARVLAARDELGYVPNLSAQLIRQGNELTLGVLVPDIHNPFFSLFYKGIQTYGRKHQIKITLISSDSQEDVHDIDNINELIGRSADGLIIASDLVASSGAFPQLTKNNIPFVVFDQGQEAAAIDYVEIDEYHGGTLAANHLLDCGHQEIAIFAPKKLTSNLKRRLAGFTDTLAQRAITAKYQFTSELSKDAGYQAGKQFLEKKLNASAIWALNDEIAIGIYKAIYEKGYKIPTDIAIIGYDNNDYTEYLQPPLTTIEQPTQLSGYEAARIVHQRILTPKLPPQKWHHDVKLVNRQSC